MACVVPTLCTRSIPFLLRNFSFSLTQVLAGDNALLSLVMVLGVAVLALITQCIFMPWHVTESARAHSYFSS